MISWLRLVSMIFYAPLRGMREARDHGSLLPIAVIAFVSQLTYSFVTTRFSGLPPWSSASVVWREGFQDIRFLVVIALIVVPILTLVANVFERRGSFRVVLTQEYAPFVATVFYVVTAVNLSAIVVAAFLHYSGIQAAQAAQVSLLLQQPDKMLFPASPEMTALKPHEISLILFFTLKLGLLCVGVVFAVKETFRISAARALSVSFVGGLASMFVAPIAEHLFSGVFGSPFLLFFLFMLFRGYFSDIMGGHRARAAFKQNLESATLNPADASAHYNLGLIHQNRNELDAARERFERAVQIDPEEVDASYQLGRIARTQKRYGDAIQHFEQVVARNPAHSLHEIWREVAATYIAAGQFEDARNTLEQFLEHRPSDPEGLYLMGRAHAGLGHRREATSLMQECIEAVKTAPAYKYRASKRWMNEAEQFIKSGQ